MQSFYIYFLNFIKSDNLKLKSRFSATLGDTAEELQQVLVPIRTGEECEEAYRQHKHTTDKNKMVCAGYKEGGMDSCQGQF